MSYIFGDNVSFVKNENPDLFKEYIYAEKNVYSHPYLTFNRLRVIYEELTNRACDKLSLDGYKNEVFAKRLIRLRGRVPDSLIRGVESLRPICNAASHQLMNSEVKSNEKLINQALKGLSIARDFAYWYYFKLVKNAEFSSLPEFVNPPSTSFEEELRWAHEGDAYAALAVSEHHRHMALYDGDKKDYHESLFKAFLDYSCDKGVVEALEWKSTLLTSLGKNVDEIREGIAICDRLIKYGIVINSYHNKAVAFARMNRKHTAINFLKKGVDAGDPYAINFYVQWSSYPENDINLSQDECIRLLEKSVSIAFNGEAAYYLSIYYQNLGEHSKAIDLLEDSVEKSADKRGLLESQLGKLLINQRRDKSRGIQFLISYARSSFHAAICAVEDLLSVDCFDVALTLFMESFKSAKDVDIVENRESIDGLRSALVDKCYEDEKTLFFLVHCLDGLD